MWGLLRKERSEWLRSASKWSSEEGVLTGPQNPNAIWIDALICWLNSCKSSAVADEQSRLGRSASGGFWVDAMFERFVLKEAANLTGGDPRGFLGGLLAGAPRCEASLRCAGSSAAASSPGSALPEIRRSRHPRGGRCQAARKPTRNRRARRGRRA